MKTHTLPIAAMGLTLLFACDNEAELALRPAVAEFAFETLSFSESDDSKEITISLSKPAKEAGSLIVNVESDAFAHFEFSPAPQSGKIVLEVPQGSAQVQFQVHSIDNDALDGMKVIRFALQEASRGLQVGMKNSLETTWTDDESAARVGFALQNSTLSESATTGAIVIITLSHAVPGDGQLRISIPDGEAIYGQDFTTVPALENNKMLMPVAAGATQLSFVVNPLNDALFNGDRTIDFKIEMVSPVMDLGTQVTHQLMMKDDELLGRAKSYKTLAGNGWASRREVHYATDGKVERVVWENAMPGVTRGERTYSYTDAGLIDRVVESPVTYVRYVRENGRIIKNEEYDNGELDQYSLYGYDQAGNIGEVAVYDRQADGSFVFSLQFVYLYYNDGNLYKKLVYDPQENGDPVLLTTHTYENYIDAINPFPLEIVYGQPIQHKLPLTYREDTGDAIFEYSFSYVFLPGGMPSSRTVSGQRIGETTVYEYY